MWQVRYNALTGGTGVLVDSAAEITHTAARAFARPAVATLTEQPDAETKSAESDTAAQPPDAQSVAPSPAIEGKGLAGGLEPETKLAAPECISRRQSLGGESNEGMVRRSRHLFSCVG